MSRSNALKSPVCGDHPIAPATSRVRLIPMLIISACVGCASSPSLDLPPHPPGALTGSQILPLIEGLTVQQREELLFQEFMSGNVPDFLRRFVPVTLWRLDTEGQLRQIRFEVLPDYLALGSDADFFRMPMTPSLGQRLANLLDCSLPTRLMVDDIWSAAPVKLAPFPFSPETYDILAPSLFHAHHLQVEQQRAGSPLGEIVAGIKKDVVVSRLLGSVQDKVVIYGWHYQDGTPIQPLYAGHVDFYADYSHGIRLVHNRVFVDGQPTTIAAVLEDQVLHPLLSDEGAFTAATYPTAVLRYLEPVKSALCRGPGSIRSRVWVMRSVRCVAAG